MTENNLPQAPQQPDRPPASHDAPAQPEPVPQPPVNYGPPPGYYQPVPQVPHQGQQAYWPPAPPVQYQQAPAQSQPGYGYPPQQYAQPAPYAAQQYTQPAQYGPPQPQWAQPAPGPRSTTGLKTSGGILLLVLASWLFLATVPGFVSGSPLAGFAILIGAIGATVSGILVLTRRESRAPGTQIVAVSVTAYAFVLPMISLAADHFAGSLFIFNLMLCVPVFIVLGIALSRDKAAT